MKSARLTSLLILITLLGLFGVAFMTQGMEHGGMTNPCPYNQGMNSICPMTIAHHAKTWLALFLATSTETLIFLSLIIFAILLAFSYRDRFQNALSPGTTSLFRFTRKSNPNQSLFSYFIHLFQTGILHPKVF